VARSVRKMAAVSITAGALAVAVSACDVTTTQQKAAWVQLNSARSRAAMEPTKIGEPDTSVHVIDEQVIRAGKETAFVVTLRNDGDEAISDLPLAIGVRKDGEEQWLNLEKRTPYFQSHIPAIAAGGEIVWVYEAKDDVPEGEPLAKVGADATQEIVSDGDFPELSATVESGGSKDAAKAGLRVSNPTGIPQYGLEAYVLAADGDRYRAAGLVRIAELDPGTDVSKSVALIGDPGDADLEAVVPPTILK
jgi:hypothetical protein